MRSIILAFIFLFGAVVLSSAQSYPSGISNLAARWEADCITFSGGSCSTPSNGSTITTWNDESGNANTATVAGGTCTFNTSQINGKPAVTFTPNCYLTIGTSINGFTNGVTMFVAMKRTGNAAANYTIISGSHATSVTWKSQGAGFQEQCLDDTTNIGIGCGAANSDLLWHQMNWSMNPSCSPVGSIRRIDQAADGASPSSCTGLTETVIGRNNGSSTDYFDGQIAALIVYTKELTLTEAQFVENYLYCKYALGTGPCSATSANHKLNGAF